MTDSDKKTFILTRCIFRNCWSVGIGGGVGDIFIGDFIPTFCEFINCSEGDHTSSSEVGGGYYTSFILFFIFR
jgi:hypothetical protein